MLVSLSMVVCGLLAAQAQQPASPAPAQSRERAAQPKGDLPACLQAIDPGWLASCPRTQREFARTRSWMPGETSIAELKGVQPTLDAITRALREPCPWPGDPLSLVLDAKSIEAWAAILDADSRRLERFNERTAALDRILAIVDLARVVGSMPRVDFQRVAVRLQFAAGRRLEAFLPTFGDAQAAARARDALLACRAAQDQALAGCIATERARWITRPTDRVRLGATGSELLANARHEPAATIIKSNEYPLARLKDQALLVELRTGEAFFDAAEAAWKSPNATALLAELQQRAEKGEFGAWLAAARPELLVARGDIERARTPFDALVDMARVKASGGTVPPPGDGSAGADGDEREDVPPEERPRRSPRKVKR